MAEDGTVLDSWEELDDKDTKNEISNFEASLWWVFPKNWEPVINISWMKNEQVKTKNEISNFEASLWWVFPKNWEPVINISWMKNEQVKILTKQLEGIKVTENVTPEERTPSPAVLVEEGNRTQYTPQVKILKRQVDQDLASKNKGNIGPQKTLQQREAEYKEARLRILGSSEALEDKNNSAADFTANRPIRLVQQVGDLKEEQKENPVTILRDPKGPDGTAGFSQNR